MPEAYLRAFLLYKLYNFTNFLLNNELDRKEPNQSYDNIDNLVFACYWCNNAKTDTFTADEFKEVGKVFSLIWQKKLAK
jgi:hypothetical protein